MPPIAMTYFGSEEHEPVTWLRGHPIYAAHLVVLVFVASLLISGVLMLFNAGDVLTWGIFRSDAVLRGEAWRIFTYGLVNPPMRTNVLWFAIDMLMLVWFGREVEKTFGRRKFLSLYACVYLLVPVLFTIFGRWLPTVLSGEVGAFAIFIAFATIYPNVPIFFTLLAKWVAIVLVGIYSVAAMAEHDWVSLVSLWSTSAFAYVYVRYQQGHVTLPSLKLRRRRKPKLRVVPSAPAKRPIAARPVTASMEEVDALLDKIAQSGIGSLTARERAKLDAARRDLKRKSDA